MSFDRYFLGGSFLPFVEIAFSVNYTVLFRVASRKIIAWRVFFPFFSNYFAIIRVPFDSYNSRNMNANF